jgi:chorismate mutase
MSPKLSSFGLVVALSLVAGQPAMAQFGGNAANPSAGHDGQPVKPTGPASKKADDLIRSYTTRIEKEIEQGRKELERLRAELHELIDIRFEMAAAIAELRGDLATKGTYSADPLSDGQPATQHVKTSPPQGQEQRTVFRRDLFYGLGTALPKDPTLEQREQLRRLAPRADLKRMIDRLRTEVEETRAEVDQLAYKLLELRAGIPASFQGFGGGMGGGPMGGPWFGSIGMQGGMM